MSLFKFNQKLFFSDIILPVIQVLQVYTENYGWMNVYTIDRE